MLEPCDGKLSRTVLRGERGCKAPDLPGLSAVKITYLKAFNYQILQISTPYFVTGIYGDTTAMCNLCSMGVTSLCQARHLISRVDNLVQCLGQFVDLKSSRSIFTEMKYSGSYLSHPPFTFTQDKRI